METHAQLTPEQLSTQNTKYKIRKKIMYAYKSPLD